MSGLALILAAVLLFESWRRGLLNKVIADATKAAKGEVKPRPFRLPTSDPAYLGGGTDLIQN